MPQDITCPGTPHRGFRPSYNSTSQAAQTVFWGSARPRTMPVRGRSSLCMPQHKNQPALTFAKAGDMWQLELGTNKEVVSITPPRAIGTMTPIDEDRQ